MVKAEDVILAAPKYLGTPYSRLDCQAFVEACLKDAGDRTNLAGSNAWYRECMRHGWVGSPDECKQRFGAIPKGAFLFILKASGNEPEKYKGDGIGNASHIGLYTGESGKQMVEQAMQDGVSNAMQYDFGDGAIHSSSSRGCVCTSKFSGKSINGGWNRIGLWDGVDYEVGRGETMESYQAKVVGGRLNLREQPNSAAERLCQIPDGEILTVTDEAGEWAKTAYSGLEGWVMKCFLERISQDADVITVSRKRLEAIYDGLGDILGLRG